MNKITADHLARRACVYIRQSTPGQVQHNLESQRRQYGLVDRARFGVDRVFDQLFHDRRGPFHDLSGGDLIHQFRREHTNRGHEAFYLLASPAWLAESAHFSASSFSSRSCSC